MPEVESLSERERRVLEAVIETYIATAEPAGSQTVARRSGLGISPASIRSTMSDLEARGLLYHPHTSAGRIPTDRAYRFYVDAIVRRNPPDTRTRETLEAELTAASVASEALLRRAAQVRGTLNQEPGLPVAPARGEIVSERNHLETLLHKTPRETSADRL